MCVLALVFPASNPFALLHTAQRGGRSVIVCVLRPARTAPNMAQAAARYRVDVAAPHGRFQRSTSGFAQLPCCRVHPGRRRAGTPMGRASAFGDFIKQFFNFNAENWGPKSTRIWRLQQYEYPTGGAGLAHAAVWGGGGTVPSSLRFTPKSLVVVACSARMHVPVCVSASMYACMRDGCTEHGTFTSPST